VDAVRPITWNKNDALR